MKDLLLSNKIVTAGLIAIFTCLTIYTILFAQHPIAHDTFHELRHFIGVSCH